VSSLNEVAQLAAVRMGSEVKITSLDDDRPTARALKAVWDIERRATIRDGSFNFSARRGPLAQVAVADTALIWPYLAAYELPADALRLIELLNSDARANFQLEGRQVLCNATAPLYARWSIDVPEPAEWDDQFAEAFACRLAWKCGRRVVGSEFDTQNAEREYWIAIGKAKGVDAKENPPIDTEESDWILARFGGGRLL